MRNLVFACVASTLLIGSAHAGVLPRPEPIVITLDGHDYLTWVEPVVFSPLTRLVLAPESSMANCHRANGEAFAPGQFQLLHTPAGDKVDTVSMRIEFHPTRILLETESGDVVCDGEASGSVTGVGRVFRDEFELDDLPL